MIVICRNIRKRATCIKRQIGGAFAGHMPLINTPDDLSHVLYASHLSLQSHRTWSPDSVTLQPVSLDHLSSFSEPALPAASLMPVASSSPPILPAVSASSHSRSLRSGTLITGPFSISLLFLLDFLCSLC